MHSLATIRRLLALSLALQLSLTAVAALRADDKYARRTAADAARVPKRVAKNKRKTFAMCLSGAAAVAPSGEESDSNDSGGKTKSNAVLPAGDGAAKTMAKMLTPGHRWSEKRQIEETLERSEQNAKDLPGVGSSLCARTTDSQKNQSGIFPNSRRERTGICREPPFLKREYLVKQTQS
jgi:hypothetical protein